MVEHKILKFHELVIMFFFLKSLASKVYKHPNSLMHRNNIPHGCYNLDTQKQTLCSILLPHPQKHYHHFHWQNMLGLSRFAAGMIGSPTTWQTGFLINSWSFLKRHIFWADIKSGELPYRTISSFWGVFRSKKGKAKCYSWGFVLVGHGHSRWKSEKLL